VKSHNVQYTILGKKQIRRYFIKFIFGELFSFGVKIKFKPILRILDANMRTYFRTKKIQPILTLFGMGKQKLQMQKISKNIKKKGQRDSVTRFLSVGFFHQIAPPGPLRGTLGQFRL